jgi:hypothetical protein
VDPTATWSIKAWIETFGGPGVAIILLVLNLRGVMWWKPQVDKLLAQTVESAKKLDEVRVEQISVERADKVAWKVAYDELKKITTVLTAELEDEKRKCEGLRNALEDEKRRAQP